MSIGYRKNVYFNQSIDVLIKFAHAYSEVEGTFFFYDASRSKPNNSFLFLKPEAIFKIEKSNCSYDFWKKLQDFLVIDEENSDIPCYCGCLHYDLACFYIQEEIDHGLMEEIPVYYQKSQLIFSFDHKNNQLTIYHLDTLGLSDPLLQLPICDNLPRQPQDLTLYQRSDNKTTYENKIAWIQHEIKQGNVYQVNLSQEWVFQGSLDPFTTYLRLVKENPTSFSAYAYIEQEAFISSSPELFVKKEGLNLITQPIKGTAKRSCLQEEDERLKQELIASSKNQSELLMITDLMRNDLAKVSQTGSVNVTQRFTCSSYTNVHHLSSTIIAQAQKDLHPVEIIKELFPGGSISGCPKLKAIEAIAYLEKRARGIYTGCLGYMTSRGNLCFNLAIRTLSYKNRLLKIQTGGAIVIDSIAHDEYLETLYKAQSIAKILNLPLDDEFDVRSL